MNIFAPVGRVFLDFLRSTGRLTLFSAKSLSCCFRPPFYFRTLFSQMVEIGFYSLPVVALTTMFSGLVIALQSYSGLSTLSSEGVVASVVELTVTRELGPVLAALMVAGRVGAAMAAELGTMRVTEQIDALTTLSTNPFKYLVVPRVVAGMLMLPVLVLIGDVIGIYGGYLICVYKLDFNAINYLRNTWNFMQAVDIASGMTKAAARELGSRGITVNAVAPGYIETDMTAALPAAARDAMKEKITLKRAGTPEDVAGAVAFLASEDADYITGQVLVVDGGMAF